MIQVATIHSYRFHIEKCVLKAEVAIKSDPENYFSVAMIFPRYFPPDEKVVLIRGFGNRAFLTCWHFKNVLWVLLTVALITTLIIQAATPLNPFKDSILVWPIALIFMAVLEVRRAYDINEDFESHSLPGTARVTNLCMGRPDENKINLLMEFEFKDHQERMVKVAMPVPTVMGQPQLEYKFPILYDSRLPIICILEGEGSRWSGMILWLVVILFSLFGLIFVGGEIYDV